MSSSKGGSAAIESIDSVAYIFNELKGRIGISSNFWFRGNSSADYDLQPRAFRPEYINADEVSMLNEFRQKAALVSGIHPTDNWGWMVLAQHYGLPTRLLDWSDNPLQGLFFACQSDVDNKGKEKDGKFFILNPQKMNDDAFGVVDFPFPLVLEDKEQNCDNYRPEASNGGDKPIAVIAMDYFPRIGAQNGCFTVCSDKTYKYKDAATIMEFTIPGEKKERILGELEFAGVNVASTYPDLDHLAQQIAKKHEDH